MKVIEGLIAHFECDIRLLAAFKSVKLALQMDAWSLILHINENPSVGVSDFI